MMAKAPSPGRVKTRLCPPLTPAEAESVAAAFAADTWSVVSHVGAGRAYLAFAGAKERFGAPLDAAPAFAQEGADLGERIEFVASWALARASAVVIVGSDLPGLPPARLREALASLGSHDAVLGPSSDGGFYLIGLGRLHPGVLHGVPWSADNTLAVTVERLENAGYAVGQIGTFDDVDTPADLARLKRALTAGTVSAPKTLKVLIRLGPLDHQTDAQ
jgi:rSAM/selenodomain-associated transferase 1